MSTHFFGLELSLPPYVVWPSFLLLCGVAGYFAGSLLGALFKVWARRTKTDLDNLIVECFRRPVSLMMLVWGLVIGIRFIPEQEGFSGPDEIFHTVSKILIISLFLFAVIRFSSRWIDRQTAKSKSFGHAAGILKPIAHSIVITIGLLLIVHELGVNVLPILTGLGVGGIAVALALQTTLSNFFAGIAILSDRQVRQGDFIRIDTGLEGSVESIGWRSTLIKTRENNAVVIPNSKLAESVIMNYHIHHAWMVVAVSIGVSYASDPGRVTELVLEEVGELAKENDFVLADPPPSCRFNPGFGDSSLDFTLRFTISSFEHSFRATDLVRRRILARFRKEGIEIPFPQRDLHIKSGMTPQ